MKILNSVLVVVLLIAVIFLFVKIYNNNEPPRRNKASSEEISNKLQEGEYGNISVAFILMDTLNENYSFQEELRVKLEDRYKKLESDLARRSRVLQEGMVNLQQQAANLTDQQIEREQQELVASERELRRYSETISNELAMEQEELNRIIYEDLESVLSEIREEYDLDFIFRKELGGSVLSADSSFDITGLVIERLEENYQKKKAEKEELKKQNTATKK